MLAVTAYRRAAPSGAPVAATTAVFGGRSCHMNSPSNPMAGPVFTPPPTTKFPPEFAKSEVLPCGKPTPPPRVKLYFGASGCAQQVEAMMTKTMKDWAAANLFIDRTDPFLLL